LEGCCEGIGWGEEKKRKKRKRIKREHIVGDG
jgi:hypothetical protein